VAPVWSSVPQCLRKVGFETPSTRAISASGGAPIHQLLLVEPLRHTRVPFAGYRTDLTRTVLPQANAYAMIRRRASAAGIKTKLGNHSFRATGITAYLKNGGTLEKAAAMANPRTPRRARPGSTIAGAIRSASMRSSAS